VLTGDPVAVLAAGNHRHDVSAETFRCQWDGKPPDYGAMVELLDASRERRKDGPPTSG
jgi:hypothetical protein